MRCAPISAALAVFMSLMLAAPVLASPSFSDVPPGSVFYDYVTQLADEGIVSGGGDGSFHPSTA